MRPMLATSADRVPTGADWLHEVKWDGMRVLAEVREGRVRLRSRNENDVTPAFPELTDLASLPGLQGRTALLDGEVVAFDGGIPRFGALADRIHLRNVRKAQQAAVRTPVTLLVFDLLSLDGEDLTARSLTQRRAALEALEVTGAHVQVPPTYDDGEVLWQVTQAQGLEGVVSKRRSSRYRFGVRTTDWLKLAHRPAASYVVGGWRPETGTRDRLGALLVGEVTALGLRYRGRVGSGVAGRAGVRLRALLEPLACAEPPFAAEVPREDAAGAVWVEPSVVVDVASLGFTPQGRLRQPAYLGVRPDLSPTDLLGAGNADG